MDILKELPTDEWHIESLIRGGNVTVSEIIAAWTPEEREQFAELIAECMKREQFLNFLRVEMGKSEEELEKSLGQLIVGIDKLNFSVKYNLDQVQDIYLKLAKEKGTA
jgi:hypothetical protein